MTRESPAPEAVIAARVAVQSARGLGITAAQDWCAGVVHVARRTWQSWEYGDRVMPPAHWELFALKAGAIDGARRPTR